jgi:enterochelin esterase-like enzyme
VERAALDPTMHHPSCTEDARAKGKLIHTGPLHAPGLPDALRVTAYLPPGHEASDQARSLAIFFDGQNMFDDEGSYRGGWQLHRLLDYRACRGQRVPVAVAIHTTGGSRAALLSPWARDGVPGRGDRLLDWISDWLIPTIRAEVRIASGPGGVLLGGSSLGGLLSLYGFFRRPDQFGRALAMSPSLGLPGGREGPIYGYIHDAPRGGGKIYLDAGERECECTSVVRHTGNLAALLAHKGYRPGVDLSWHPDPDGAHDEASWKRRLPGALDFLCH